MNGWELIVGSSVDVQFGPIILFGAGGVLVEVIQDRALGLPPLNRTLARRLIERGVRVVQVYSGGAIGNGIVEPGIVSCTLGTSIPVSSATL